MRGEVYIQAFHIGENFDNFGGTRLAPLREVTDATNDVIAADGISEHRLTPT